MELTPAQQHVQRVLAEQSRPTVTESSNGTLLMQLIGDRQEIGSVQSFEARAELKREKLPHYAGFIEGVLANQVGLSEDDTTLLQELFVWTVDTFELSQVRQLYAWMLEHRVVMPARMNRNLTTFTAEELSEGIKAKLSSGEAVDEAGLRTLNELEQLFLTQDMIDVVRAKWYKQLGLLHAAAEYYAEAHRMLTRANQLDDKCGVKTELKRLDKLLEAHKQNPSE